MIGVGGKFIVNGFSVTIGEIGITLLLAVPCGD